MRYNARRTGFVSRERQRTGLSPYDVAARARHIFGSHNSQCGHAALEFRAIAEATSLLLLSRGRASILLLPEQRHGRSRIIEQGAYQSEESLVFRAVAACAQELSDLDQGRPSAGSDIRTVLHHRYT
jgi:hypothetical protein